jgi:hypothetical protein
LSHQSKRLERKKNLNLIDRMSDLVQGFGLELELAHSLALDLNLESKAAAFEFHRVELKKIENFLGH